MERLSVTSPPRQVWGTQVKKAVLGGTGPGVGAGRNQAQSLVSVLGPEDRSGRTGGICVQGESGWEGGGDCRGGGEGQGRTGLGRKDRKDLGGWCRLGACSVAGSVRGRGGRPLEPHPGTEGCAPGLPGQGLTGLSHPVLLPGSASVRLPVKLGEKLERYHTAIQVGGAGRAVAPKGEGVRGWGAPWPPGPLMGQPVLSLPRGQCLSSPPAPPAPRSSWRRSAWPAGATCSRRSWRDEQSPPPAAR